MSFEKLKVVQKAGKSSMQATISLNGESRPRVYIALHAHFLSEAGLTRDMPLDVFIGSDDDEGISGCSRHGRAGVGDRSCGIFQPSGWLSERGHAGDF